MDDTLALYYENETIWWEKTWCFHDFWCQIAIAALLHTMNTRCVCNPIALSEVMPIVPPWECPRWL